MSLTHFRGILRALAIAVVAMALIIQNVRGQTSFQPVWRTVPWDSGGLHPSSVVWSMTKSELDLDNDGKKEFLCSTAWSDSFYNMAYLYERTADNNFQRIWSYSFYPYSNDFSTVAVGDLDQDGRKEILCLVDPADSTFHGFYVFEWDGTDNGFPLLPTTTWNLNLPGAFDEGTAIIAGDFDNDGRDEVAVTLVERWSVPKSRFMIFSLAPGSTFQNPSWVIEYQDSTTFPVIGYSLESTDLDRDGRKEIVVSGWDWLHLALYENTGSSNSYVRAANIAYVDTTIDFSNMGFLEANFDNNGTNELYIATTLGKMYVMTNPGDVSLITLANFSLLYQYNQYRGIGGISKGDIDGNGIPELYVAGGYHEGVFQWKYNGGSVILPSSYQKNMIFQDDTTDNHTPGSDQGWFRPAQVAVGDFDSDGTPDIVIASASFAGDKPILMVVEQTVHQYSVNSGWNMESLPLTVSDPRKTVVYPSVSSAAFAFDQASGYVVRDTLRNGEGFWLKFSSTQSVNVTGSVRLQDSIAVRTGWNLIGSISIPVVSSAIQQIPPGIVISNYFGYNGGYVAADTLQPGKSYWVKASLNGKLVLR